MLTAQPYGASVPHMQDIRHYLTIPQAARVAGVSPDTIRRRIKSGELPASLFAKKYRIRPDDLDALVAGKTAA